MTTRRTLCGWFNFEERFAPQEALAAMLAGERLAPDEMSVQTTERGAIASSRSDCSAATGLGSGCIAAVLGRPRWADAALQARARSEGHAAAVLAAYREAGNAFLETLGGNFALVLMDERRARVLLAVDRCGTERPCFACAGNTLAFPTSARAVARHPQVAAGLSRQAISEYLYCHMVPSPDTVFDGVEKLLPALVCVFYLLILCKLAFRPRYGRMIIVIDMHYN